MHAVNCVLSTCMHQVALKLYNMLAYLQEVLGIQYINTTVKYHDIPILYVRWFPEKCLHALVFQLIATPCEVFLTQIISIFTYH